MDIPHKQRYVTLPLHRLELVRRLLGDVERDGYQGVKTPPLSADNYALMALDLLDLVDELEAAFSAVTGVDYAQRHLFRPSKGPIRPSFELERWTREHLDYLREKK